MKMFKKLGIMMMAVAMMAVGSLSFAESAGATSTSNCFPTNNETYGGEGCIYTSESGSNINASYVNGYNNYHYVTMTVQRYYNGRWNNIESKSGYAERAWGVNKQFHATFYGYANKGQSIRIRVQLRSGWSGPSGSIVATGYSKTWVK